MPLQKRKKKVPPSRRRIGVTQIPIEKGWESVKYYFHNEIDKKANAEFIRTFIKNHYTKDQYKKINANPEYKFTMFSHYGCTAFWVNSDLPINDDKKILSHIEYLKKFCDELLESGTVLYKEKLLEQKAKANVIVLSPQQRLERKINSTIMIDLDDLEDAWIEGEKADIDVYTLFRKHGLTGSATLPVKRWLRDGYLIMKMPTINDVNKLLKGILT